MVFWAKIWTVCSFPIVIQTKTINPPLQVAFFTLTGKLLTETGTVRS